jgi:hypothetical protein
MFKVRQLSTDAGVPVKNQFVIEVDRFRVFQSYETTIAIVDTGDWSVTLDHDWDISRTTVRWLKKFLENELPGLSDPPLRVAGFPVFVRKAIADGTFEMRDINNREEI